MSMRAPNQMKLSINGTILDFKNVEKILGESICEGCFYPVQTIESVYIGGAKKGETFTFNKGCKCEDLKLGIEAKENQKRLKRKFAEDYFNTKSLINEALKNCTFDNYKPTTELQKQAFEECLQYANEFNPRKPFNLLMSGDYGIGKSHLSVSIVRELLNKGFTCIFSSAPKLLTKIRATFNKNAEITEDDLLSAFESVDLLVIDDLGAETVSDWTTSKLFEIIDARAGKHTIYTTNLDSGGLRKKIGERNFSRLMNQTRPLKMDGEDFRLRGF